MRPQTRKLATNTLPGKIGSGLHSKSYRQPVLLLGYSHGSCSSDTSHHISKSKKGIQDLPRLQALTELFSIGG